MTKINKKITVPQNSVIMFMHVLFNLIHNSLFHESPNVVYGCLNSILNAIISMYSQIFWTPLCKRRSFFPSLFHVSLYSRLCRLKRFARKLKHGFQMTDGKVYSPVSSLCPFISPYLTLYISDSADLIAPIESACEQSKLLVHSAEIKERAS